MNREDELILLKEENARLQNLLNIQETIHEEDIDVKDLINIEQLQDVFNRFSTLTGYTTGLVHGETREVLISSGWTDICKNFHRGVEESAHICKESNMELTKNLSISKNISFKECQHGMVDGATPLIIDGKHLADIFSGQVLLEQPDLEKFALSSKSFGYDMESYMKALSEVKTISQDKLTEVLEFLSALAKMIMELGKDKKEFLKLNALLEHKVQERTKELNIMNDKLKEYASIDFLTQLANRHKLDKTLEIYSDEYSRCGDIFSLILLDIDSFKLVNDTYGHMVGDIVIKEIAHILKTHTSESDVVGRFGGEEFLIICKNRDKQQAYKLAQTLRELIQNHQFEKVGTKTASFGVANIEEGMTNMELLKNVDDALYDAKESGKNRVVIFYR